MLLFYSAFRQRIDQLVPDRGVFQGGVHQSQIRVVFAAQQDALRIIGVDPPYIVVPADFIFAYEDRAPDIIADEDFGAEREMLIIQRRVVDHQRLDLLRLQGWFYVQQLRIGWVCDDAAQLARPPVRS